MSKLDTKVTLQSDYTHSEYKIEGRLTESHTKTWVIMKGFNLLLFLLVCICLQEELKQLQRKQK